MNGNMTKDLNESWGLNDPSLVYHIPFFKNHRRSLNKHLGTTYQFYIWRSKK